MSSTELPTQGLANAVEKRSVEIGSRIAYVSPRRLFKRAIPCAPKIVFVHTPMSALDVPERRDFWRNFDIRYHAAHPGLRHMRKPLWELPHWMTWLAGVLVDAGYQDLEALDFYTAECALTGIDQAAIKNTLVDHPGDVFLFSPMTPNLEFAFEIAELIKQTYPRSVTIFGGVVATPLRNTVAAHPCVDYLIHGRAEYALPDLLDALEGNRDIDSVGNLCLKRCDKVVSSAREYPWMMPSDIPFPKVNLFPTDAGLDIRYLRQVYALGCPYKCQFCTIQTIGRKPSYFPVGRVIEEINAYRAYYGEHHNVYFGDETFTANKESTFELCDALREVGGIFYDCQTRLNLVDDLALLRALRLSGCVWLEIGIESVNQRTQDAFKQRVKLEQLREKLKVLRDAGLPVCSFVVNGFPDQTVDDMRRSIDAIGGLIDEDLIQATYLFGLVPYPGSDFYARPQQYGITLHHHDFKLYHEDMPPVFSSTHATPDQAYEVFLYGLRVLAKAMERTPYFGSVANEHSPESFGTFWSGAHV